MSKAGDLKIARKRPRKPPVSASGPPPAEHFERVKAHFSEFSDVLDAVPENWWPFSEPESLGKSNYNLRASCGSCVTFRLAVPCVHLSASCVHPMSDVPKPHTYSLKKSIKDGDDLDAFIMSVASKLCTCGRKVWNPKV